MLPVLARLKLLLPHSSGLDLVKWTSGKCSNNVKLKPLTSWHFGSLSHLTLSSARSELLEPLWDHSEIFSEITGRSLNDKWESFNYRTKIAKRLPNGLLCWRYFTESIQIGLCRERLYLFSLIRRQETLCKFSNGTSLSSVLRRLQADQNLWQSAGSVA